MGPAAVLAAASLLAPAAPAPAFADTAQITEWTVPWAQSRPRDPYVAPDGRIWFVGQRSHYAAVFDPGTSDFKRFDLEDGTGPHNLIVDRQGRVWYAGNGNGHIGRLDPRTGAITRYPMPDPAARDPHTLVFDGRGDIWFTVQGGNFVGRLATATGKVELVRVPTEDARPYGIVVDPRGRPWFNEFGSNKIATVDPATLRLEEIALPRAEARTRRIGLTTDGAVWYVDYAGGMLGRLDPATRRVKEWPMPGGASSRPYAMAVDDRDRVWFVETGARPNRLVGFDPRGERFFGAAAIASGGGAVRHMVFHAPTREIWFGTDTNTLGRARLP